MIAAEAKARQRQAGGDQKTVKARENQKSLIPKPEEAIRVVHQIAAMANVAPSTVSQAKKIKDTSPSLAAEVVAGTISLNDAYKQVRSKPGNADASRRPVQNPL
jgi:hypothetical protein